MDVQHIERVAPVHRPVPVRAAVCHQVARRAIEARVGKIMTAKRAPNSAAASKNITKRIQELGDWRGETLAWVRQRIHDADPEIEEEWKWEKPS